VVGPADRAQHHPDSQTCRDRFWAEHAINVW